MSVTPYLFSQGVAGGAHAASGNITVTLPVFGTDHIGIVYCAQHDNIVSTITAGWTIVDATNNTTAMRAFWAWRRMVAGDTNPVITHAAGDSIIAQVVIIAGVRTSGNPHSVNSVLANASSSTITTTAITTPEADDLILFLCTEGDDSTYSGYSGTNPVFVEVTDDLTGDATDSSLALAIGRKTDASTTGARTATSTRTVVNIGYLIALVGTGSDPAPLPDNQLCVLQARNRSASF